MAMQVGIMYLQKGFHTCGSFVIHLSALVDNEDDIPAQYRRHFAWISRQGITYTFIRTLPFIGKKNS